MPELSVVILSPEEEQRTLLQLLVDGTGTARTRQSVSGYPAGSTDGTLRRILDAKPDVVITDIHPANPGTALRAIELLHAASPSCAVFAVGEIKNPQLIVSAMRAGAREFLERPVTATQLLEAFTRYVSAQRKVRTSGTRGRVFAFLNAKGGCGATSIAVNTALALSTSQGSTTLVDAAPIGAASLHLNTRPSFSIADALRNLHRLDSELLDGYMTRHPSGLHLLAGSSEPLGAELTGADFARLFDLLVAQYRSVVVDLSTRLDQVARMICDLSDQVIVITHTDVASLWSASQVEQHLFGGTGRDKLRLLLNRYRKVPGLSDTEIEAATRNTILCKIPNQYAAFSSSIDRGIPIVQQNHSELAGSFQDLASLLTGGKTAVRPKSWLRG